MPETFQCNDFVKVENVKETNRKKVDGLKNVLPKELFENPELLVDVLTLDAWETLTEDQKLQLEKLLPTFGDDIDVLTTRERLLSGKPISHHLSSLNPVTELADQLKKQKETRRNKLIKEYNKCLKMREEIDKIRRMSSLLTRSIVDKANIKDQVKVQLPPEKPFISKKKFMSKSALAKYNSLKETVKQEIESSTAYTKEDMETSDDSDNDYTFIKGKEAPFSMYKDYLHQYAKKRRLGLKAPELDTTGLKLSDVVSRTVLKKRKYNHLTTDLFKSKRRQPDENLSTTGKIARPKRLKRFNEKHRIRRLTGLGNKKYHDKARKSSTIAPKSFFELIKEAISLSNEKTTHSIQQLAGDWLKSAQASLHEWTSLRSDWSLLVPNALEYLRTSRISSGMYSTGQALAVVENGSWKWTGQFAQSAESHKNMLVRLCKSWTDSLEKSAVETASFQEQEARRFLYSHQAFVYIVNGSRYTVPPVKGCNGTPENKPRTAREHSLLRSERPAKVTLLALTRDAVARLPKGFGTRNDICTLVRQSQYLQSNIVDSQILTAVGNSLDRLHTETDPCVKYEPTLKGWLYLHAKRTAKELERIYSEQQSIPKKKAPRKNKKPLANKAQSNEHRSNQQQRKTEKQQDLSKLITTANKSAGDTSLKKVRGKKEGGHQQQHQVIHVTQQELLEMKQQQLHLKRAAQQQHNEQIINNATCVQMNSEHQSCSNTAAAVMGSGSKTVLTKRLITQIQHRALSGQPGIKLILRPGISTATGAQAVVGGKSVTGGGGGGGEMMRVMTMNGHKSMMTSSSSSLSSSLHPHQSRQFLTDEALQRLSQQLSVASNRPIKIIHQTTASQSSSSSSSLMSELMSTSVNNHHQQHHHQQHNYQLNGDDDRN